MFRRWGVAMDRWARPAREGREGGQRHPRVQCFCGASAVRALHALEVKGGPHAQRVVGGVAAGYGNTPRPSRELKWCPPNLLVAPSGSRTFPGPHRNLIRSNQCVADIGVTLGRSMTNKDRAGLGGLGGALDAFSPGPLGNSDTGCLALLHVKLFASPASPALDHRAEGKGNNRSRWNGTSVQKGTTMDLTHNSQHDFLFLFSCFLPSPCQAPACHTQLSSRGPRDGWILQHLGSSHSFDIVKRSGGKSCSQKWTSMRFY